MTTATMREVDGRALAPANIDEFRTYVREWAPIGLAKRSSAGGDHVDDQEARVAIDRAIQRTLWDAGLAGILFPVEYGGLGLTREHQKAFLEETDGYELPRILAVTHGILIPTLMDFGSEEQKLRHIPASLRGEEIWVQLLSEPGAGSDMAGALTRAEHRGKDYVVNGAKIWTTFAHVADFGLLLCRTDPDRPKHRGLSVLIVPLVPSKELTINRIRLATGRGDHFCEEFFDDLVLPGSSLLGTENDGWTAALRLLFHERNMIGDVSYHDTRAAKTANNDESDHIVDLARSLGADGDQVARQLVGEALTLSGLVPFTLRRVTASLANGSLPDAGASLLKHLSGEVDYRRARIAVELAGPAGAVWAPGDDYIAMEWLDARIRTIGGGTSEAQRNVISERVLGLPRELSPDKDIPFSQVRHNG